MFLPRINAWIVSPPPETWGGLLAQSEITVEKAVRGVMDTGREFGNANDSVRFGIAIVLGAALLLAAVYVLVKALLAAHRTIVDDLRAQIKKAEDQRQAIVDSLEKERNGRREDQEQRNSAMQYSISEFITKQRETRRDMEAVFGENTEAVDMLRRLLNLGTLPARRLESPMQPPEQPSPPANAQGRQPSEPRSNFLPAGPRRIPRRVPREGNLTDENT